MLEDDFKKAVKESKELKLDEDERVRLWVLFLHSTRGDADSKLPNDVKNEEWQIWRILRGIERDETKQIFIKNVRKLMVRTF